MKVAIVLYTPKQVALLPNLIAQVPNNAATEIIAFGADVEYQLESQGHPYRSVRPCRKLSTADRLTRAKQIGEKALQNDNLSFFVYKNIHIGKLYTPALQYYLGIFLYYFDIAAYVFEEPYDQVVLCEPSIPTGAALSVLERWNARVVYDAVSLICREKNILLKSFLIEAPASSYLHRLSFRVQRAIFSLALRISNTIVRLGVPKKSICILASELWKNIAPLMHEMPDAELLLLDRREAFAIGWRSIARHRMQFLHAEDYLTSAMHRHAVQTTHTYTQHWSSVRAAVLASLSLEYHGHRYEALIGQILDYLIESSVRVVTSIDGAEEIFKRYVPNVVLVRAGISAQTHFAMLCELARLHVVPSVEIQHGILSGAEHDFTRNPSSEYIAEYGPLVREELEKHAFAPRSTFIDIGSPRFDALAVHPVERTPNDVFSILHIGPPLSPGGWNDTYDVYDYFDALAQAVRPISYAHVIIKLRGGGPDEPFLRKVIEKTLKDLSYEITTTKPLIELFPSADVVVSCHSTALLEALLAAKPLIIDASLPIYQSFASVDLQRYKEESALLIAENSDELKTLLHSLQEDMILRRQMSAHASEFMDKHFMLRDGRSSERLAVFIRSLVQQK